MILIDPTRKEAPFLWRNVAQSAKELWFVLFGETSRDQASQSENCAFLFTLVSKGSWALNGWC